MDQIISDFDLDCNIQTFYSTYPSLNLDSQIHYWNIYKIKLQESYSEILTLDTVYNFTKLIQCYDVFISTLPLTLFDNITNDLIDICNHHLEILRDHTTSFNYLHINLNQTLDLIDYIIDSLFESKN